MRPPDPIALLAGLVLALAPAPALARTAPAIPALAPVAVARAPADTLQFLLTADPEVLTTPYTGRLYVMLTTDPSKAPRAAKSWSRPQPVFARDVTGWDGRAPIRIADDALGYPVLPSALPLDVYRIQGVARVDPDGPDPGEGTGDVVSAILTATLDPTDPQTVRLHLDEVVAPEPFPATDDVRELVLESARLSAFHGRPVAMRAGVALPPGWEPGRAYPVVWCITGFGGTHADVTRFRSLFARDPRGAQLLEQVVLVTPDARSYRGHTVFVDSETNGPWGSALLEELIPAVEGRYAGGGAAEHRYVTGNSSGGWASLWLQVRWPDAFAGCWSMVPDPVDFHDFQRVDLYSEGSNLYVEPDGTRRPVMRRDGQVVLHFQDFVAMETVYGPGGQIHAFEAAFGPRGEDGEPLPFFDRATGAIDTDVTATWRRFDVRLQLEQRWDEIGPRLADKLHVWAGAEDSFYLEGAVARLARTMERLGSDAVVEVVDGMGHAPYVPGLVDLLETAHARFAERAADSP